MNEEQQLSAGPQLSQRIREIDFIVEKLGIPALVAIFLGYMLWVKFGHVEAKIDRTIRNTRAIMQKMEIPIIVGNDDWDKR